MNYNGITIGQVLGIYPMYSKIPPRFQYRSKLDGKWKDCPERELSRYEKYLYETRKLFV